jgi:hypothetical protein
MCCVAAPKRAGTGACPYDNNAVFRLVRVRKKSQNPTIKPLQYTVPSNAAFAVGWISVSFNLQHAV